MSCDNNNSGCGCFLLILLIIGFFHTAGTPIGFFILGVIVAILLFN